MSYRSKAFIDRCSATLPIDRSEWNTVTDNLFGVANQGLHLTQLPGGNERGKFQLYHFCWKLTIGSSRESDTLCFIQAYPTMASTSFMRIDWNPAKAGTAGTRHITCLLDACVPNFRSVWEESLITRVDITFDVRRLPLGEVYAFTQSSKTRHLPYKHGFYLGVPKSERRLLIYDKHYREFMQKSGIGPPRRLGEIPYFWPSKTRFEFRFLRLGMVNEIPSFKNGLLRYSIALKYKAHRFKEGESWRRFLLACDRFGAQAALALITDAKRRARYRKILDDHCSPSWYDKEKIWKEATHELGHIFKIK